MLSRLKRVFFAVAVVGCSLNAQAGYTHYFTWRQPADEAAVKRCVAEMQRIIEARQTLLAGPDGHGPPLVSDRSLQFNGIAEDECEPFIFPGYDGFNFCKTQWKPYDEVVTACLIVARDHFPRSVLEIDSDGDWDAGAWAPGAKLYTRVFGRPARSPMMRAGGWAKFSPLILLGAVLLAAGVSHFWLRRR